MYRAVDLGSKIVSLMLFINEFLLMCKAVDLYPIEVWTVNVVS
jgi:hypothetical protein